MWYSFLNSKCWTFEDPEHWELAIFGTFLLGPDGFHHSIHLNSWDSAKDSEKVAGFAFYCISYIANEEEIRRAEPDGL
jgi:hypothetical protein